MTLDRLRELVPEENRERERESRSIFAKFNLPGIWTIISPWIERVNKGRRFFYSLSVCGLEKCFDEIEILKDFQIILVRNLHIFISFCNIKGGFDTIWRWYSKPSQIWLQHDRFVSFQDQILQVNCRSANPRDWIWVLVLLCRISNSTKTCRYTIFQTIVANLNGY